MAADLECRLPCGCWVHPLTTARGMVWQAHRLSRARQHVRLSGLDAKLLDVIRTGYAIAASRGLGPWAERWPG